MERCFSATFVLVILLSSRQRDLILRLVWQASKGNLLYCLVMKRSNQSTNDREEVFGEVVNAFIS